jgi:hypothetical protein
MSIDGVSIMGYLLVPMDEVGGGIERLEALSASAATNGRRSIDKRFIV